MSVFDRLLNLLFPPRCAHCQKEGEFLCKPCLKTLKKEAVHPKKISFTEGHLDQLIYAVNYHRNPVIQSVIRQFKYQFHPQLAEGLAKLMDPCLEPLGSKQDQPLSLIPIPLHPQRQRQRGFNPAQSLAQALAKKHPHFLCVKPLLERVKDTPQQAKLNREERLENLKGAFRLRPGVELTSFKEEIFFLVDDVYTTGATLESAAEVLKQAGFQNVYGLVIARVWG